MPPSTPIPPSGPEGQPMSSWAAELVEPMSSWAAELVAAFQLPREVQPLQIGQQYAAVVPAGATVRLLSPGNGEERYRAGLAPAWPEGEVFFDDTKSFIGYVVRHFGSQSEIYVDQPMKIIRAVFDWHLEEPGWGLHRATLRFRPDPDWQAWEKINRRLMSQQDFVEFLEEQREDIVTPSAATVMEACAYLEVTTSATFSSRVRLSDGTTAFSYSEDQKNGQVKVPQELKLRLCPFFGSEPFEVCARVRTSIKEQKLTFKVLVDRPHKVIEAAMETEANKIREAVKSMGIPVFNGIPSAALI